MAFLGTGGHDAKPGGKPSGRASNVQLLFEHDMTRQAKVPGSHEREYITNDAYPPSTTSLAELSKINIADLQQDTRHAGKVLFVRTIESGFRAAAVQDIVEDESGDATKLALRNSDPSRTAEELLPDESLFAVKEPYFSTIPSGGYGIRIDHPSDLVPLSVLNSQIPQSLRVEPAESGKSAQDWKNDGNKAYGAQDFLAALRAYGQALEACGSTDTRIRFDVLRNRAAVNIFLERFTDALADAKAAVVPAADDEDPALTALNGKAYERAGHAAYQLGRFEEAASCYKKVQELVPGHPAAASGLQRIEKRLQEQSSGSYDFAHMKKSCNRKNNRLDHASFVSNTEIRHTENRGNGLFTGKTFAPGEVIMVEKALCVSFDSDKNSETYTVFNNKTEKAMAGTQAMLLFKLVQILLHDSERAERFFTLFDGGDYPKGPLQHVDGSVPVDTFRVEGIVEHNSYACHSMKAGGAKPQPQTGESGGNGSTGLWWRASHINHACDGNAMRSFIGDMMIVRATKDIPKGEEIMMPYRLPDPVNAVTQEALQKTWGFKCDCSICVAEGATPHAQRKKRAQVVERLKKLLPTRSLSVHYEKNKADIALVESLRDKMRGTYDESDFENKARLALVAPGQWLCRAYMQSGLQDKAIEACLALLRDLGFIVTVDESSIRIQRQHCISENTSIDTAMDAARAFSKKSNDGISQQFVEFAQTLYLICNGETSGFKSSVT